jgi:phosphoglycolate phosphatase-like HAD superfamily hydrolase
LGDHPHDVEMAHKVEAHSVYLLTGHGKKHEKELLSKPDFIANDIYEAAVWITEKLITNKHRIAEDG